MYSGILRQLDVGTFGGREEIIQKLGDKLTKKNLKGKFQTKLPRFKNYLEGGFRC